MNGTVQEIVEGHLCAQCGACVSVCPQSAVTMVESCAGLLEARVDNDLCSECGQCLRVCPGRGIEPADLGIVDPFRGPVLEAYAGSATDPVIRSKGQSGGLVSALLVFALETGLVDAALVTSTPEDGSLKAVPSLARSRREILLAQGSKYNPVAILPALQSAGREERVAAVLLPCHMHALRHLTTEKSSLTTGVRWSIGLLCDRVLSYLCFELMAQNAGLNLPEVRSVSYTPKARAGRPGEVRFLMQDGREKFFPSQLRLGLKEYCVPARCRLCFDKMNVFADICVGDPWGLQESEAGESVALARNQRGAALLAAAVEAGYLDLREVEPAMIFAGQDVDGRKESVTAFSAAWRDMGQTLPKPMDVLVREPQSAGGISNRRRYRDRITFNTLVADSATREAALTAVRNRVRKDENRVAERPAGRAASRHGAAKDGSKSARLRLTTFERRQGLSRSSECLHPLPWQQWSNSTRASTVRIGGISRITMDLKGDRAIVAGYPAQTMELRHRRHQVKAVVEQTGGYRAPDGVAANVQLRPLIGGGVGLIGAHDDRAVAGRQIEADAERLVDSREVELHAHAERLAWSTSLATSPEESSTCMQTSRNSSSPGPSPGAQATEALVSAAGRGSRPRPAQPRPSSRLGPPRSGSRWCRGCESPACCG